MFRPPVHMATHGRVRAATGPYTLPYFDQNNWVTGDITRGTQGSITAWVRMDRSSGRRHCGGPPRGLNENCIDPGFSGNFILIRHPHPDNGNQRTLYLHIAQGGADVAVGQSVIAGQRTGTSGNSGYSCGAHLHYGLFVHAGWEPASNALDPNGRWTTDPGRVPWLAAYHSESNPYTVFIQRWATKTHWVKFTNVGGRPWTVERGGRP